MSSPLVARGKVREIYDVGGGRLALVASDRISAYDVIMPTPIPGKGRVLTAISRFWFDLLADVVPNHSTTDPLPADLDTPDNAGRTMVVRRLEMFPVECVARGYLSGSAWKEYTETGEVAGHRLPPGLTESDKLPEPIFTPATKATSGHDENITRARAADILGGEVARQLEYITLELYCRAERRCAAAGVVLADTKFEFGRDAAGVVTLGDEVLTPDSSRFWPAGQWKPGGPVPSFDKQYVRDWLDGIRWNRTPPGPALPADVVDGTRRRYIEAYERITGSRFDAYLEEHGVKEPAT